MSSISILLKQLQFSGVNRFQCIIPWLSSSMIAAYKSRSPKKRPQKLPLCENVLFTANARANFQDAFGAQVVSRAASSSFRKCCGHLCCTVARRSLRFRWAVCQCAESGSSGVFSPSVSLSLQIRLHSTSIGRVVDRAVAKLPRRNWNKAGSAKDVLVKIKVPKF